jgi:hypothetical protein
MENIKNILEQHCIFLKNNTQGKCANLSNADLRRAYLIGADLIGADLNGADLSGADLSGANLSGAKMPIFCKWIITIKDNLIVIGCKEKTIQEWDLWFLSDEIYQTPRNADEFKRIYANYLAVKIYYETCLELPN